MKRLVTIIGILGVVPLSNVSTAFAQDDAPGAPVMVQMPDGSVRQAVVVQEPKPEPKQFAITFNPLNLFIGRYGFNFEYQPVLHHGLIVTPHYDTVSADMTTVDFNTGAAVTYKDSFSGFGTELGYRFYTGEKGFNGFFFSPSLLLGTYKSKGTIFGTNHEESFSSIGWAFDVGGQGQIGNFIIGGGGGFQYTKVSKDFGDLSWTAAALAGGGWRPRIMFNIGFAF